MRLVGGSGLVCEMGDRRRQQLLFETGPDAVGVYLLTREEVQSLEALPLAEPAPASRQALLLCRKRLAGARVTSIECVRGTRHVDLETTAGRLSLGARSLTLVADGQTVAVFGRGPTESRRHVTDAVADGALDECVEQARRLEPRLGVRALLERCPTLGRLVAAELAAGRLSPAELRAAGGAPVPTLLLPKPLEQIEDADLQVGAVGFASLALRAFPVSARPPSWREAAARYLLLTMRGAAFREARTARQRAARTTLERVEALESHLVQDQARLPEPAELRRLGEALLAAPASVPPRATEARVPDPYLAGAFLMIPLDPALDAIRNAERFFARARRGETGRARIAKRLSEVRASRLRAEAVLEDVRSARTLEALPDLTPAARQRPHAHAAGPLHYLTSRGLSLLVGRGARENQRLTFQTARPDDLWFHVREGPGAHVVLRDNEGRARAEDQREAAEVAAFFSSLATEGLVDVHAARRKHVRPGKGGPGRVLVGHAETLRVRPRDPEGRLRRR